MLNPDIVAATIFHGISQTMKDHFADACDHMPEDMHPLRNVLAAALNIETARRTGVEFDDEEHGADPLLSLIEQTTALKGAMLATWDERLPEAVRDKWKQLCVMLVCGIEADDDVERAARDAEWN